MYHGVTCVSLHPDGSCVWACVCINAKAAITSLSTKQLFTRCFKAMEPYL